MPARGGRASRRRKKVALVCAGGGVTGAVYEIGCLRALDEILDRSVVDLDIYVGVSGGAFVASLLASGISPQEMYAEVTSPARSRFGIAASRFFRLGTAEVLRRSARAPRVLSEAVVRAFVGRGDALPALGASLFELLPAGILDTSGIQEYLHELLVSRNRGDHFRDLERPLFVVAVDLDTGAAVAFGDEAHRDIPVSKAVQASTALPGLYRPVRIDGRDYVDGGVKKTAHINLAIQNGADLVLCINPMVPIHNPTPGGPFRGPLSERGVTYVLDQVLRIMLHGRMEYGLERYRAEHPEVDVLVIEPLRDDLRMFSYNIMSYGARRVVAEHGYASVLRLFRDNARAYGRILRRAGIGLRVPPDDGGRPRATHRSPVARSLAASLDRLGTRLRRGDARERPRSRPSTLR